MKNASPRVYLMAGLMFLILFVSVGTSSCTSHKPRYSWTDLQHSRELDKKKGKRAKKYQKNVARAHRY